MVSARIERRAVDGILLLDKAEGPSSNAALQQIKRLFRAQKAGHTGSLDPLASGMLPVCFGEATKLCGYLLDANKRYRARARLGVRTATGDREGEVVERRPQVDLTADSLNAAIPSLLGRIRQVPPMYSALKRDGRPLYELAREGIEIERAPREVEIRELRLTAFADDEFEFEVCCSKGTYVRTLAEDWAARVGQVAHLLSLRRIEVESFAGCMMRTLPELEAAAAAGELDDCLLPPLAAVRGLPQVVLDDEALWRMGRGQAQCGPQAGVAVVGTVAVCDQHKRLRGIAHADGSVLQPVRWLKIED